MPSFNNLSLELEAPNEECTFSEGDTVRGSLSFNLKKDAKVKSITVKIKGFASVYWSTGSKERRRTYSDKRLYFKVKQFLVPEFCVIPQGAHNLEFALKIPNKPMPSTFATISGNAGYVLEAKIRSSSWSVPKRKAVLQFVSKAYPQIQQALLPLEGNVTKGSKGQYQLTATVNRSACFPGDTLSVSAHICNFSSKTTRPKFRLYRKIVLTAPGDRRVFDKKLSKKMFGEAIRPGSEVTASCEVTIPQDAGYTINNCDIISVEFYIKVSLDISFAYDPEVVFPLLVVPHDLVRAR
ncbi:unnamed protein product [Ophioblennius macclurei]